MATITTHIERFISHFDARIKSVAILQPSEFESDFRKTLYVALIDGMSKSVFPRSGNRDRFVAFIERFADWPEGSRVSLPHLVRLLSLVPNPEFEEVRKQARSQLAEWMPGHIKYLESDPPIGEILDLWPSREESRKVLHGIRLTSLKHSELLYTYRNSLVHEFRSLGFPIEDRSDKEPFYIHLTRNTDSPAEVLHVWQLNYPEEFFRVICENSLASLRGYLHSNMVDPIHFYSEGSYFLEEMNV